MRSRAARTRLSRPMAATQEGLPIPELRSTSFWNLKSVIGKSKKIRARRKGSPKKEASIYRMPQVCKSINATGSNLCRWSPELSTASADKIFSPAEFCVRSTACIRIENLGILRLSHGYRAGCRRDSYQPDAPVSKLRIGNFAPKGPKQISPGQRPGDATTIQSHQALKGRNTLRPQAFGLNCLRMTIARARWD